MVRIVVAVVLIMMPASLAHAQANAFTPDFSVMARDTWSRWMYEDNYARMQAQRQQLSDEAQSRALRDMGFDAWIGISMEDILSRVRNMVRTDDPHNTNLLENFATAYLLGNQAPFTVVMGPVVLQFRGAQVYMVEGLHARDNDNSVYYPTNFVHARSGWSTDFKIDPQFLANTPALLAGNYKNVWMKGYLTRQIIESIDDTIVDQCSKRPAYYVYRYQYHAPDGKVIAFYQRPAEAAQLSKWKSTGNPGPVTTVCTSDNTAIVPPEPDDYWSSEKNASLDTSNQCRPVIRWADGSVEEFAPPENDWIKPLIPKVTVAPPELPTCSTTDTTPLRTIDRNGNITSFSFSGTTETRTDSRGRKTVLTYETTSGQQGLRRLRSVELPSIGNAPPLKYTINWGTRDIRFDTIWPDVVCHSIDGTVQPCSWTIGTPFIPSQPAPSTISVVESILLPDGRSYRFEYGDWGNLTKAVEPGGAVHEYVYGGAGNLSYGAAAVPLFNRLEPSRQGALWSGETVKMAARGMIQALLRPDGDGAGTAVHTTTYNYALRKLALPGCQFDRIGVATAGPDGCAQVWKEVTQPDLSIVKSGSIVRAISEDITSIQTIRVSPPDKHGWPIGEETWSPDGALLSATGMGDKDTGELWYDFDVVKAVSTPYAFTGNVRPYKVRTTRDGLTVTTNIEYGNTIDIDPDPSRVELRNSTAQTSTCLYAGTVNDRGCAVSNAVPLLRTDTTYLNYFSGSPGARHLLPLPRTTTTYGPKASGGLFDTAPLTETTVAYDELPVTASGLPASVLDPSPGLAAGSPRGNPTSTTQRVNAAKTIRVESRYFDDGEIQSVRDGNGFSTVYAPDFALCPSAPLLTSTVTNALNHKATTVSDCLSGLTLKVTDPNNVSSYTQYDSLGRAVETAGPGDQLTALPASGVSQPFTRHPGAPTGGGTKPGDAAVTGWSEYLDLGIVGRQRTVTRVRDGAAGGSYSKTFTDGLDRVVQIRTKVDRAKTGFDESVATSLFDGHGRTVTVFAPCYAAASDAKTAHCGTAASTTTYDGLGRVRSITAPGNRVTTNTYGNQNGRWLTTTVNPRNFTTKTFSDLLGRVVQVDRQSSLCTGGSCSTKMDYDAAGRLLHQSDSGGNTIDSTYDLLGRKLTMSDPDMGKVLGKQWTYDYDDNGNLTAQVDAKGQRIEFKYDALNRLTLKDMPPAGLSADDVSLFYDGNGPTPPADNPVPAISSLTPSSVNAGSGAFALTVRGSNFVSGAEVSFNGAKRVTTFLSSQEITAAVTATDVQTGGAYSVTVTNPPPGGGTSAAATFVVNAPPTAPVVTITSPAGGQTFVAPANITVAASVSSATGIAKVAFYQNGTLIAEDTSAPYSIPWNNVTFGSYALTAVVTDVNGLQGRTGQATTITVSDAPAVSISVGTGPYYAPATIGIDVPASTQTDTALGLKQISLYANGALLASASQTWLLRYTWNNVPAGTYQLTAVATNYSNISTTSAPVSIAVQPQPANNAVFVSQSVPDMMVSGGTYNIAVTMQNTGTATWTPAASYRLGSQSPQDNTTWGTARVNLASSVAPGAQATFQFTVTAPATPGSYVFQWKMVQDGVAWFGAFTDGRTIAVKSAAEVAAPVNYALGMAANQTTTATADYPWIDARRAVDGNPDGNYGAGSVTHTTSMNQPYWETGIPGSGPVKQIDLWNRTDCCAERLSNFYVFILKSGTFNSANPASVANQTNVWSYSYAGTAPAHLVIPVPSVTGTSVRIQLAGQGILSLAEVQVWSAPTWPLANAAQSSTYPDSTPVGQAFRAADGSINGMFGAASVTHTNSEVQPWWQAELSSAVPIDHIDLWNRTDCCSERLADFYLFVSDVPFSSTTLQATLSQPGVSSYYRSGAAGQWTSIRFNRTGRYVRVQLAGTAPGVLSLAEVQVFSGTLTPAPAVSLTGPSNGQLFMAPATVPMRASVTGGSGSATVQYYSGTTMSGTSSTGPSYGFDWTNVAAGDYTVKAKVVDANTDTAESSPVTFSVRPANAAVFVSQNVPAAMTAGQTYLVTVVMKNSGAATWTAAAKYEIGSAAPQNNMTWGRNREQLSSTASIGPDAQNTFQFNVTAPSTPGTYQFQWQMVRDNVEWFGQTSAAVMVTVSAAPNPVPAIATSSTYRASSDYASSQGQGNWFYADSTGAQMTFVTAQALWQGTEASSRLWGTGGQPGANVDAVRQWKAPVAGTVRIRGNASDGNGACGNGVIVSIKKGTQTLWQQTIDNGNAAGFAYDLTTPVAAGETIAFTINSRGGDDSCDATNFDPAVVYVTTYRASSDYSGTQGQANWYYLDGNGSPMNYSTADGMWHGPETYNLLWSVAGHPGAYVDAVRQWKAPLAGSIRITGSASDGNVNCGNGVIVSIKRGTQTLWQQTIDNGNTAGFSYDLALSILPGEPISFVINNRGGDWVCDGTNFDPAIQYVAPPAYRASTDFSSVQGIRSWHYVDGNNTPMTFNPADGLWHGSEQYHLLWSVAGHPGTNVDAVRQWRAPVAGVVRITGNASDANGNCGNGVVVSINKGTQVLWQQTIANGNTTGFAYDLTTTVAAGDQINFLINSRGDFGCDSTNFDPSVQYIPAW